MGRIFGWPARPQLPNSFYPSVIRVDGYQAHRNPRSNLIPSPQPLHSPCLPSALHPAQQPQMPARPPDYTWAFWARPGPDRWPDPSPAAPGPTTNPIWWAWAEILKPVNFFFTRARPEMLFLVCGARPSPGPAWKVRPDASNGMVMGRIFFGPK
jgi:hypothetical protein